MKRGVVVLLLAACLGCSTVPVTPESAAETTARLAAREPLLTYCDLVSKPETYGGKPVRVVGIFRVGFEWQELYSLRCPEVGDTWLDWAASDACPGSPQAKLEAEAKSAPEDSAATAEGEADTGATFGLIARGVLVGVHGGFGHLDAYSNRFVVVCIERFELLSDKTNHKHALTPDMRYAIDQFETAYTPNPP